MYIFFFCPLLWIYCVRLLLWPDSQNRSMRKDWRPLYVEYFLNESDEFLEVLGQWNFLQFQKQLKCGGDILLNWHCKIILTDREIPVFIHGLYSPGGLGDHKVLQPWDLLFSYFSPKSTTFIFPHFLKFIFCLNSV